MLAEIDRELADDGGADEDAPDAADLIAEARERRTSMLSSDDCDEM
ncbi:hypothetical protein [Haloechinothrix salitolerans]|uniref:Uncharacterized protein n=1 Tax=Haloechinothrix salitolerans TaxID=926830 RepID=A0ABW2CAW7_9PSEU